MNRREFLAQTGSLATLVACGGQAGHGGRRQPGIIGGRAAMPRPDYLAYARQAAAYIRSLAVETPHGLVWRQSPDEPGSMDIDLYHGSAGPALFLLELFRATRDEGYLRDAKRGADHIEAVMPTQKPVVWQLGLFGGLTGHGVVFLALARTTGETRYVSAAHRAMAALEKAAQPVDGGGAEYDGITDMFYGSAGIVLWLLEAEGTLGQRARELAVRLGDGLLARGRVASRGRRWLWTPEDTAEYPNFSHGTAGVAYALARLYEVTREERFLAGALAGAQHLLALAHTDGDVCLIPHILPDGRERYYLGYCHGPAGTSRLFHQLHKVTHERSWDDWLRKSINGVLFSGFLETRTPGFWDNVGQCCGSAALVEFMLSLHRLRGDGGYLELAHRMAADIVARSSVSADGGLEWIHAENRVEPYWMQSFSGYMQGAAGIGSCFVRLAGHDRKGAEWKVRLPDNPFPV